MDIKKLHKYSILFPFFILIYFFVQNLIYKDTKEKKEFYCEGIYKTLINQYPLQIRLNNEKLSWEIDIPNQNETYKFDEFFNDEINIQNIKDLFIGPSIMTVLYAKRENIEFNTKYSDGVYLDEIDNNKISIKWFLIEGTFIKDVCQLEMPIELSTIEKFIEFYPF